MDTKRISAALVSICLSLAACGGDTPAPTSPDQEASAAIPQPSAPAPLPEALPSASASAKPTKPPAPPPPTPVVVWKDMATPESVLYDEAADRYLVSNINGKPLDVDNNGFISELSPDGKTLHAKWIEASDKAKLDAPKGMAIVKGVLYVSDISTVRMFDAKTGKSKGEIKIDGASFLNDVAAAPDGRVFVSDSGLKAGAKDFEPTGTDAVYVIEKGKAKVFAKAANLLRPNGLLFMDKSLIVNTFGADEVFRLDDKGQKTEVTKVPQGALDGLVPVGDSLLVSSWAGSAIYRGKLGGTFEPVLVSVKAPADIAYDKKRNRVIVPRFVDSVVEAYDLK